jgi:hypothetical protein
MFNKYGERHFSSLSELNDFELKVSFDASVKISDSHFIAFDAYADFIAFKTTTVLPFMQL